MVQQATVRVGAELGLLLAVGVLASILLSAILFASRTVADLVMRDLPPGPLREEEGPAETGQPMVLLVVGGMAVVLILLSMAGAWLER